MGPGDVVADRFEIERVAGSGGMGIVYRAIDRVTGGPVALKMLREPERDERFLREAKILADLNHPRIVKYIAHGTTLAGDAYLAMEWLEGEDLSTRLTRSGLDIAESVDLVTRIAESMAPAHDRGLVHRDIKPRNIFLPNGDLTKVKLLDFGLARSSRQVTVVTRTGMQVGTPGFMAPEQARGERVDPRADVFSLGCVLFQCLTGRRAFGGDEAMAVLAKLLFEEAPFPSEIRPGIPPELDVLVATMLCKDPKGRPENAGAVVERLGALGDLGPTVAERPPMDRPSSESLTTGEKHLLSVILARRVWQGRDADEGSLEAEEIAARESLRATVARFGGRMEALVDGSVAITLGAARPATDQAAIAARCALAVREHCPDAPVALATGRGEIAGRVPIGEAIDRAARLFAVSDPDSDAVRLDALTAGLLDARFSVEQSASGLRLLGEREATDGARTLLGRPTACVGRDRELATLMAVYEECVSEPVPRVVLVTGEAGVGKSRLRYELVRRVEQAETPAQVWIGRGDPMRAGSPFGLLAEAVRRAAGLVDGEPAVERREKLRARLAQRFTGETLARISEFIGELVGAPFPDDDRVQLRAARENPVLMGDQIRRAWEEWLAAECAVGPLVLILEDLHWGDLPTVGFVDGALRALKEAPFMVVALARPSVEDAFPRLWSERSVLPLPLSPLTKKASEKLVRSALGSGVTDDTLGRIVERAQGNAFYLEELVRSVAEGRGDSLPETVLAMVQARVEAFEPAARRVLRAASVFGQVFWRGAVLALMGGEPVDEWLAELTSREAISRRNEARFAGEVEYIFRHTLLRDAAYATLTEADGALGHRLAAEWLAQAGEQDAMGLADHFERGRDAMRAVGWYLRAAEQALEGNDLVAAVARSDRAVACGAKGEDLGAARAMQAEAFVWRGEAERAVVAGSEATMNLLRGSPTWWQATANTTIAAVRCNDVARAREIATDVETMLQNYPALGPTEVGAASRVARYLCFMGETQHTATLLGLLEPRAATIAAEDPGCAAHWHAARALYAGVLGDLAGSLALERAATDAYSAAGDRRGMWHSCINVGCSYVALGAYEEAEVMLREAVAMAGSMGMAGSALTAKVNLGLAVARRGDLAEGCAIERAALDALQGPGADQQIVVFAHVYMATLLAEQRDLPAAELEASAAVERATDVPTLVCPAMATFAAIALARGRPAEALEAATLAYDLLVKLQGIEEGEAFVRLTYAQALRAAGNDAEGCAQIAAARERLLALADKVADPVLRASFLERVPENARTMALAQAWLGKV